jgi:cyclophilin family peptidyl-prolyl cis-trans isomerase
MARFVTWLGRSGGEERSRHGRVSGARSVFLAALCAAAIVVPCDMLRAQEAAPDAPAEAGTASDGEPTREAAEAARNAFLESERELKQLVGQLSSFQTEYQRNGSDRPKLEADFEIAKAAAQVASRKLEAASMVVVRAGIPKRGEVDDIDVAMPVYQSARKVCSAMVAAAIKTDDPEQALVLLDTLERVGAIDGDVLMMGATASMLLSRIDDADAFLAKLSAVGGSDDKQARVNELKDALEEERKKVAEEMAIRAVEEAADDLPRVRIITSAGDVVLELFENQAPNTVANFVNLVEKGFYAGTPFHRVIPEFMAQGGDPTGRGDGDPGYAIPCETGEPNARKHFRGSISMAHAGKDTGGSQFFLTFRPTEHLDGKHTVFGRVIEGFEVLPKIKRTQTPDGRPIPGIKPDTIVAAEVVRKRPHDYEPDKLSAPKKPR